MSLNEIVDVNYKPWLNPVVNSIKIDGEWSYKESEKTAGDNLILDSNLVAHWITPPLNTPYGNGIAVRPAQQNINNLSAPLILNYLAPFSPLFSFTTGSNHVTIVEPGTYLAYANITYHDNVANTLFLEFQQQTTGTTFVPVSGSKIRSFPGTMVFNGNGSIYQSIVVCSSTLIKTTSPNRQIRVVCSTSPSSNTVDTAYSSFTLIKVSSV